MQHMLTGSDNRPTLREVHSALYGYFDWHLIVRRNWVVISLLLTPNAFDVAKAMNVLNVHLTEDALSK